MRRHRSGRDHLSDIFYTTGDMELGSAGNNFGVPTEDPKDKMLREERLEKEHRREEELRQESQYPNCKLSERPPGWTSSTGWKGSGNQP